MIHKFKLCWVALTALAAGFFLNNAYSMFSIGNATFGVAFALIAVASVVASVLDWQGFKRKYENQLTGN